MGHFTAWMTVANGFPWAAVARLYWMNSYEFQTAISRIRKLPMLTDDVRMGDPAGDWLEW